MTEQEWLTSEDPAAMLRTVRREHETGQSNVARVSDRKLRLWVEACRKRWPQRKGAGDLGDVATLRTAVRFWSSGWAGTGTEHARHICDLLRDIVGNPFRLATRHNLYRTGDPDAPAGVKDGNGEVVLGLCRDCGRGEAELSGPCRWLTPTVVSLAQAAYDERVAPCGRCGGSGTLLDIEDFDTDARTEESCGRCHGTGIIDDGTLDPVRLAILADALEEAGCPAEEDRTEPVKVYVQNHGQGWYVMHGIPSGARIMHKVGSRREAVRYAEEVYRVKKWTTKSDASTKLAPSERPCWGDGLVNVPGGPHPLLAHLREPGAIHVRGCWAVDLILGKS